VTEPGNSEGQGMTRESRTSRGQSRGGALVEFALIFPLLFLLIVNVVNFGGFMYAWISVSNAARAGAQYWTTAGATIGGATQPSASTVQTLVANDLKPLLNSSTAQVCVSASTDTISGGKDTTASCNTGSAPSSVPPSTDTSEGGITYPVGAVDVTYTYTPFISLWDFSALGIHATLPPTSIHRQAKMRILQ